MVLLLCCFCRQNEVVDLKPAGIGSRALGVGVTKITQRFTGNYLANYPEIPT